ncbi:MAG: hypothetical protein WKH64_06600 [Chloroflexia bacterium]
MFSRIVFGVFAVMLALGQSLAGAVPAGTSPAAPTAEARLLGALDRGGVQVAYTGDRPRPLRRRRLGRPVGRAADLGGSASPEARARAFLGSYGSLFGADDQAVQLRTERVNNAGQGRSSVRFQQLHKGVPVIGGEMYVNLSAAGDVLSANGELSPAVVATAPRIGVAAAQQNALNSSPSTTAFGKAA